MTQRQLAVAAGVPQSTVGRIETDRINPTLDTIRTLLRAAGRDLDVVELIGQDEDRAMLRDRLRMTPAERAGLAIQEVRAFARIHP